MPAYDPDRDAYAILGVRPDATHEEITRAYRRAVLIWHPDKSAAPDAATRFREIQEAAGILRKPGTRREYDALRTLHHGRLPRAARPPASPEPYVPILPPPLWLSKDVRVERDAVIFPVLLERPSKLGRAATTIAFMAFGAAIVTTDLLFLVLALVAYAIGRLQAIPPQPWRTARAKLVPGLRLAEYTELDRRAGLVVRYEIPFASLSVALVLERSAFVVEIRGFPAGRIPLMDRTRDLEWARRCARDASAWLGLPLARAA
ncbi:MAG: J domain-containing protein [Planctomycetota bacterium]